MEFSTDLVLPAAMFSMVLAIGLTLTGEDFRRVVNERVAIGSGLALQLVAMPALGLAIALGLDLPALLGAGLVLLALLTSLLAGWWLARARSAGRLAD